MKKRNVSEPSMLRSYTVASARIRPDMILAGLRVDSLCLLPIIRL